MPIDVMDQRQLSFFFEELLFPNERQVGIWRPESMPDHRGIEGMSLMADSKSVPSSPMGKLRPVGKSSIEGPKLLQQHLLKDQMTKSALEHHLVGAGNNISSSMTSWQALCQDVGLRSNVKAQTGSLVTKGNEVDVNRFLYENNLFSSSLSELLNRKLKVSLYIPSLGQSVNMANSTLRKNSLWNLWKKLRPKPLGTFSLMMICFLGLLVVLDILLNPTRDDIDDDIFCTGGGMELEGDSSCINGNINNSVAGAELKMRFEARVLEEMRF